MIMSGVPKPNRAGASETWLCATVDWSRGGIGLRDFRRHSSGEPLTLLEFRGDAV